ncbi:ABC transporter ATP-binding protein [Devosia algicola]|uniref:ABC transporter ATP-binding protein n=1 Tax=Devosia algicola TaxID=3026418 RepID=UPI002E2252FE
MEPLLEVRGLKKHFPVRTGMFQSEKKSVKAVDDVTLHLNRGETLGVVGESGSGKSTLGRLILKLLAPTAGEIFFEGTDITDLSRRQMLRVRRDMQIIFQDPYASLNPRMTVEKIVGEPLLVHNVVPASEIPDRVGVLLEKVGLHRDLADRYPHEFSGGQRQRIGIARALALSPKLIVADEAVSALDVSVQAQVVNLLQGLKREPELSYIFIAHDLSVVRHMSDRVAVMYLGKIVEVATNQEPVQKSAAPLYARTHFGRASPQPKAKKQARNPYGEIPNPIDPPSGCSFHGRCKHAMESCRRDVPQLVDAGDGHLAACPVLNPPSVAART